VGGTCGTYGGGKKCLQGFNGEKKGQWRAVSHLDPGQISVTLKKHRSRFESGCF